MLEAGEVALMPDQPAPRNAAALVIGVGNYPHPGVRRLEFAAHDAEAVRETLIDGEVCSFPAGRVQLLLDDQADRDHIVHALSRWLPLQAVGAEIVVFYFAGHGVVQKVGPDEEGFLLPVDADPNNPVGRGVSMREVSSWLKGLEVGAVVICLDCCHAGKILPRGDAEDASSQHLALPRDMLQGLAAQGRFLLAACDQGQVSVELKDRGHGLFTYHLLEGLYGKGDRDSDGKVGVAELFEYVAEAVSQEARRYGVEQHPWNASVGAGGVWISKPTHRGMDVMETIAVERIQRELGDEAAVHAIEQRMEGAAEPLLLELLRKLGRLASPAAVPVLFRSLLHSSKSVADLARRGLQTIGWEKALNAVEEWARQGDPAAGKTILDGLAVFEARADQVRLLDRLTDIFTGDLRVRALQLWEQKRLGLDLEQLATLFREHQPKYRLERVLGQGSFTAAYLARHQTQPKMEVVVRVLRREFVSNPEVRRAFLELCRTAMLLNHHNLVRTLDLGEIPSHDLYYILRQHVAGVTLQAVLAAGRSFEPVQAVEILRQVAEALKEVHSQGGAHGGVKPSNLFFCSGDRVVLGDLSLPPQGVGEALEKRLAYDYRYAAPEILQGKKATVTSDLYALGCVGYELVCGTPPFVGDHHNEVLIRQVTAPVPPPRQRLPGLARSVDSLLLWLLEKNSDRRVQSTDQALERIIEVRELLRKGPPPDESADGFPPPDAPPPPEAPLTGEYPVVPGEAAGPVSVVPLMRDPSLAGYRAHHSLFSMGASRPRFETVAPQDPGMPATVAPEQPSLGGSHEHLPVAPPGYEILGPLGRGGMGVVYKARQIPLDRIVALKILPHASLAGPEPLSRFEREVRSVAFLHHPNIVAIYDAGMHEGCPYFSMEYVDGGTLGDRIRNSPQSPREAAVIVEKLARAAHYAHEKGILHRDLKPTNVLLDTMGEPKIADFGLAKREASPADTGSGVVLGTPMYMAPEQAEGRGRVLAPWTDVYALGGILYALLTGRPPFRGAGVLEILDQVRHNAPVPPRQLQEDVPVALERICLKCLEKDPAARYQSALELAEDLHRFQVGEPVKIRPAPRLPRWVRIPSPGPRSSVQVILLLLLAACFLALLWYLLH
jgi:serine/threonine protein kinase